MSVAPKRRFWHRAPKVQEIEPIEPEIQLDEISQFLIETLNVVTERGLCAGSHEGLDGKVCLLGAINVAAAGVPGNFATLLMHPRVMRHSEQHPRAPLARAATVRLANAINKAGWQEFVANHSDDPMAIYDRAAAVVCRFNDSNVLDQKQGSKEVQGLVKQVASGRPDMHVVVIPAAKA